MTMAPGVDKGIRVALDDGKSDRAFLVHGGDGRYPRAAAWKQSD